MFHARLDPVLHHEGPGLPGEAYELPEANRTARGQHVANLLAFQPEERIAQVIQIKTYEDAPYLVLATLNGLVKKSRLVDFDSNRSGGIFAINLRGEDELAARCAGLRDELNAVVNERLWTGERYAYGFGAEGDRFGDDGDGRTYLNIQTWAIISGAATGERLDGARRALASLDTPCGPLLLDPPFAGWDPVVGRLSLKPAGLGENASVYCHGGSFAAFARTGP